MRSRFTNPSRNDILGSFISTDRGPAQVLRLKGEGVLEVRLGKRLCTALRAWLPETGYFYKVV